MSKWKRNIYIIADENNNYKVGISNNATRRLADLQTSNASKLTLVYIDPRNGGMEKEKIVHEYLAEFKVRGEWFSCGITRIKDAIDQAHANCTIKYNRPKRSGKRPKNPPSTAIIKKSIHPDSIK